MGDSEKEAFKCHRCMSNYIGVLRHITLYRRHVVAYLSRQAIKRACRFHSSVPGSH